MTLLWWWLAIFGMWPLADPGHDHLGSLLVLLDLVLHGIGIGRLWHQHRERVWFDGYRTGWKSREVTWKADT